MVSIERTAGIPAARATPFGDWLVAACGLAGFAVALYEYVAGPGIAGTPGTLLVSVSTFLIFAAALVVAMGWTVRTWQRTALAVLILLGIVGTIAAAYFLEATLLLAIMLAGLFGWVIARIPAPAGASGAHPREAAR